MKPINTLGKYLFRLIPNKEIKLGDSTYIMPYLSHNKLASHNKHESWLDDIYTSALSSKKGCFVDVGVNVGQTLMKLLYIDPDRRYIGFEPQVYSASCVHRFIVENNLSNLTILPIGLSDTSAVVELKGFNSLSALGASIVANLRPDNFYTSSRNIYVTSGDNVLSDLNIADISVIKIDVEGAELEVVKGFQKILDLHKPFIVFEVLLNNKNSADQNSDKKRVSFRNNRIRKLEKKIKSFNYDIYFVNGNKSLDKIDKISQMNISESLSNDFIAVPHEYEDLFLSKVSNSRHIVN